MGITSPTNKRKKERQTVNQYVPPQYATDTNREFNPETEVHHIGFLVKVVDPGCTLEVQIEERSGILFTFRKSSNTA